MYLLFRLIKSFINGEVSIDYFSSEFNLIYSRYDGLYELELDEFNIDHNPKINVLYDKLNDLCSRYYGEESKGNEYGYSTKEQLKNESNIIYRAIVDEKLLQVKNDIGFNGEIQNLN